MFWCEVISSSKNNWVGHIVQMFLGIMTSRTARSYFKRFHWISSVILMSYSSCTQVGFPHPSRVTVPCDTAIYVDTALKAVAERYIVLGWTSCICNSPPLPPTYVLLASIVLLCFIEYTLKADTPDIWPKLNFCSHRRWAFLPYFLTSIQTPHLWYYWCTRQYGHVRAVFDSILNNFFLEFVQAQDLLGFVALGPRTPIFKNWV